jgi:hypothetical protein
MQYSIDHYNVCAKRVLVRRGVLESSTLRAPAAAFDEISPGLLDHHLAQLSLGVGDVRAA